MVLYSWWLHLGSRDGTMRSKNSTVMRAITSHHCGSDSIRVWCHMQVEFVVGSCLYQGFFSDFHGFPLPTKTNISNFKFNQIKGPTWNPSNADVLPPLTTTWKRILPTPPIWFQMAYLIKTTNVQIPAKKLPNAQGLRREGAPRMGGVAVMLMSTYI